MKKPVAGSPHRLQRDACRRSRRRGAMLPLMAILLPVLMIVSSLIVNVAYMELTRTELQVASDAATRAAGYALASTNSRAEARLQGRAAASRNKVAGQATSIANGDFTFGIAQRASLSERYSFAANSTRANAVRINLRRNAGSGSGVVRLPFPSFGGVTTFAPVQQAISSKVELDVVLVLDRSGSMAYGDTENSYALAVAGIPPASAPPGWAYGDPAPPDARWLDLAAAVDEFILALTNSPQLENLAMATYSDGATVDVPLTRNYSQITTAIGAYSSAFQSGRTNIGGGIVEGVNALNNVTYARPWASQAVIVLTDGIHNIGTSPEGPAGSAFAQGAMVYTVTFSAEADQTRMRSVASLGGGKHYHASTAAQLRQVFREIASSLPNLLVK